MTIKYAYSVIHGFVIAHQLVTFVGVVALGLFWWKKPKAFFNFTITILVMITVFYIFTIVRGELENDTGGSGDYLGTPKWKESSK